LELYTAEQLIGELMRRKTFLGVVVQAEEDCKTRKWQGDKVFKVHFNANLSPEQAGRLLDVISDHLDRNYC
jgi:hypothetical protein